MTYRVIIDYRNGEREDIDLGAACTMALGFIDGGMTYGGGQVRSACFHNGRPVKFYNAKLGRALTRRGYASHLPSYMQGR